MDARPVGFSRTELGELMLPHQANVLGKVFGGTILAMIDKAAATAAIRQRAPPRSWPRRWSPIIRPPTTKAISVLREAIQPTVVTCGAATAKASAARIESPRCSVWTRR